MFKNFRCFRSRPRFRRGRSTPSTSSWWRSRPSSALLIAGLIVAFAFKYRRRHDDEVGVAIHGSLALELLWTIIPFVICMVMFAWGAKVFFDLYRVPAGAMEIFVVGKQWMWKVQHMDGKREINELHVPIGRPVKLIMGSEDVIHSFYIPAFRVKADVIPGRYNTMWFTATKPGTYHLFCAEYCGTKHSGMIGSVIVMEPAEYQAWLDGGRSEDSPVDAGEKLFTANGCVTCHVEDEPGARPDPEQPLRTRGRAAATAARSSPTRPTSASRSCCPQAKIVAGFQPIMPTFQGLVIGRAAAAADCLRQIAEQPGGAGAPTKPRAGRRSSTSGRTDGSTSVELPQ